MWFEYSVTPHAKRAFFISFTPLTLSFISGSSVMINYATAIFKKTGSSLSDKDSALLLPIVQILANILMLGIVERFNRRVNNFHQFKKTNVLNESSNYFHSFSYSDAVHLVITFNYSQLPLFRCLLLVLDGESCIQMDSTILFCLHRFLQLLRSNANSLRNHMWSVPWEGKPKQSELEISQ